MRVHVKITPHEKRQHVVGRDFFLVWGDFHTRSRFARSTIPEEKWGTTCSLCLTVYQNTQFVAITQTYHTSP